MKKSILYLICCLIIVWFFLQNVNAGDVNNPEITDGEKDVVGPREFYPLPKIIYSFFKNIDIISGWFSENQQQLDILSVSIKIKTFSHKSLFTVYTLWWEYNGIDYVAALITHSNGVFEVGVAGYVDQNGTEILNPVDYTTNQNEGILTFDVPKNMIGNPLVGDELTDTWIWTGARFQNELLAKLYSGELAKDFSDPYLGTNYIIQY